MHTINANVVQGRSYENFSTRKFVIQKFCNTKISRSTVSQIRHTSTSIKTKLLYERDTGMELFGQKKPTRSTLSTKQSARLVIQPNHLHNHPLVAVSYPRIQPQGMEVSQENPYSFFI